MMETIIIHKGDSLHNAVVPGGGGGAVVWKTVWMILMICCACRQLLGCIQVGLYPGNTCTHVIKCLFNFKKNVTNRLFVISLVQGQSDIVFKRFRI